MITIISIHVDFEQRIGLNFVESLLTTIRFLFKSHVYFQTFGVVFKTNDRILMDNLSQRVPMYENVGTVVYDEPFPQQSTSKLSLLIAHVCSYPVATATYATFVVTAI